MTSLVFEIFGTDAGASDAFDKVGDAAARAGDQGDKAGKSVGGLSGIWGKATSGAKELTQGWGGLITVAGPLVQSVGQLTGVLGLVPAGAAFAGASLATLKIGFTGVGEAITAYGTAMDAAEANSAQMAAQSLASANSLISAAQAVDNARQAYDDAKRNSTNTLIAANEALGNSVTAESTAETTAYANNVAAIQAEQHAEEQLQAAHESLQRAQQGLIDAQEAAKRSLQDMPNRVQDAYLAAQRATHDLTLAQQALVAPSTSGAPKDVVGLSLAVQDAQQRIVETQLAYQRAQEDASKAAAAGVDGAQQVINAQDQLNAAQRAEHDAETAQLDTTNKITTTRVAGEQAVAAAKQRVGDMTRAQQQAEIAGDEQVAKAKQGIDNALRSQQQAIAQAAAAADSAVGSLHAYNAAVKKLAPSAQEFVGAVTGLRETYKSFVGDVQQHLFAGLGAEIKQVAAADLPVLDRGLSGIADGFDNAFLSAGKFLSSKDGVAELDHIFGNFDTTAINLSGSMKPILQIILDLVSAGSDFLPQLAQWFTDGANKVADFVRNAKDTGQLKDWIQGGIDAAKTLFSIVGDLIVIFKNLMGGSGWSVGLLDMLKTASEGIRWLTDHVPWLIPAIAGVITVVAALGGSWIAIAAFALWAVTEIIKHWSAISGFFAGLWHGITDIFWSSIDWIHRRWDDLVGFVTAPLRLFNIWQTIWDGFRYFVNLLIRGWDSLHFGIPSMDIFGVKIGGFDIGVPQIPYLATGGLIGTGGLAVVGEKGPEAVLLPTGARVLPAPDTAALAAAQQPHEVNVGLEFYGNGNDLGELLIPVLQRSIRVRGGNVQSVLGAVA